MGEGGDSRLDIRCEFCLHVVVYNAVAVNLRQILDVIICQFMPFVLVNNRHPGQYYLFYTCYLDAYQPPHC